MAETTAVDAAAYASTGALAGAGLAYAGNFGLNSSESTVQAFTNAIRRKEDLHRDIVTFSKKLKKGNHNWLSGMFEKVANWFKLSKEELEGIKKVKNLKADAVVKDLSKAGVGKTALAFAGIGLVGGWLLKNLFSRN